MNKKIYGLYIKNNEKILGLPIDITREVPVLCMSFYLQHRDEVKIQRGENGKLEYLFDDGESRVIFNNDQMEDYLLGIGFKGPKISVEPPRFYTDVD